MAGTRSFNLLDYAPRAGTQEAAVVDNYTASSAHFVVDVRSLSANQYLILNVYGVTWNGVRYRIFRSLPMNRAIAYRSLIGTSFECIPGIVCRDFMPQKFILEIEPLLPLQQDTYAVSVELSAS